MTRLLIALAAAGAAAPAPAQSPPARDKAAVEAVKKAVAAHGGAAALAKVKAGSQTIKGTGSTMGVEVSFTGKVEFAMPDKFKLDMTNHVLGQKLKTVTLINGKTVRVTANGAPVAVPPDVKKGFASNIVYQEVLQLTPLLDTGRYGLKAGPDADVGALPTATVVVSGGRLGGQEWTLYFGKAKGLLVRVDRPNVSPDGGEVEEEYLFTDYKPVGGVMTAGKVAVKHDGKPFMSYTVTDTKYAETWDPKAFAVGD